MTDVAHALLSPNRLLRDEAERALLARPGDAEGALVDALGRADGAPPEALARLALLVGALRLRAGLKPLLGRLPATTPEARAAIARAAAELLDGRDAFDDEIQAALEQLALDRDATVRAYAAEAFAQVGDGRALARVRALADDADRFVQERAARALASLQHADAPNPPPTRSVDTVERRLASWLRDLGDRRRAVQQEAIARLVAEGPPAVAPLIERLHQPQPRVRIAAAHALGQLRAPAAAGPLLIAAAAPALTPEEGPLAAAALRALVGCLTGQETGLAPALIALTDRTLPDGSPDRLARAAALLCLGRLGDREGIRYVAGALCHADPLMVESATIALSEGVRDDDTDLVLPLLEAFDVRPRRGLLAMREGILIALSRIVLDDPALRVRVRHRVRHEVGGPTASLRRLAIALCADLYAEDDPPVLPLVEAVLKRLDDEHADVRVVAASFLAEHVPAGLPGAAERLQTAFKRQEPLLRPPVLGALARLCTPEAKEALLAATRHDDRDVALLAAELVERAGEGVPAWTAERPPPPERRSFRPSATPRSAAPRAGRSGRLPRAEPTSAAAPTAPPRAQEPDVPPPEDDDRTPPEDPSAPQRPETDEGAERAQEGTENLGEGDVVEARFVTEEGAPMTPAQSLPEGEMPGPDDDSDERS